MVLMQRTNSLSILTPTPIFFIFVVGAVYDLFVHRLVLLSGLIQFLASFPEATALVLSKFEMRHYLNSANSR